MLRHNDKKINAAFGRLRDKRQAVGETSHQQTLEEETQSLKRQMEIASATGDIGTIISLITKASALPEEDYVETLLGGARFMYYSFLNRFHVRPVDMIDMIDGTLFIDAYGYIEKKEYERARQQVRK